MKKVLYIILISIFSLTIISCSDEKEEYSATDDTTADNTTTDNTTTDNTTTDNTTTTDTTSPTVESISPTDNHLYVLPNEPTECGL